MSNSIMYKIILLGQTPSGVIENKDQRERAAKTFMRLTAFLTFKWRAKLRSIGKLLDGEENTSWIEMTKANLGGAIKSVQGHVETIRNNYVYTIQYTYTPKTQMEVNEIIESFRFEKMFKIKE